MEKTMHQLWLDMPADTEVRKGCTPIDWAEFKEEKILNDKFLIREAQNTVEELTQAAEVYRTGFPALRGCDFELLFDAKGFSAFLGDGEQFNKGNFFMMVIEEISTKKLVCCLIITMQKMLYRGELLVIATHEKYQSQFGLGKAILNAADQLYERSGVEMAYGWCAAMHTATQRTLLSLGYTVRAVIPGLYRLWAGGDNYRRTVEVFLQKFYGGAEKMCTTELNLVPEAQNLVIPWR